MQPSSTGRLLGLLLLVTQPASDWPSKSSSQPSCFSFAVSSLSAAGAGPANSTAASITLADLMMVHHPFLRSHDWTGWKPILRACAPSRLIARRLEGRNVR